MTVEPYPDAPPTRDQIEAAARKVIADNPDSPRPRLVALTLAAFKGVAHPDLVAEVIDQLLAE